MKNQKKSTAITQNSGSNKNSRDKKTHIGPDISKMNKNKKDQKNTKK